MMSANDLTQEIIRIIEKDGPITFEKFMDTALYDPRRGYYRSGNKRIGREGDFYTSSHLHPAFGATVGRQIMEFWEFMGKPRRFDILEMGAGAGYLCKDILDSLSGSEVLESLRYFIVEPGNASEKAQKALLRDYPDKVDWVRSLGETGEIEGCLLSNELLDAFPLHLVRMEEELREIYVDVEEGRLIEASGPLSDPALLEYFKEFSVDLAKGYKTEVNLRIKDWLRDAASVLVRGFVLTIDYGYTSREYYSEDRNRGTLMCYRRHQATEDPLVDVGEQDITAHVNFSAVRKWGEEAGFDTIGFCGQGAYLASVGIDEEIRRLDPASKDYPFELARIKKLLLPQGLGESHQVMIQYKGPGRPDLKGFKMRNRMKYL